MTSDKKSFNYRFPLWLTVIFFTLFSIPLFVFFGLLTLAKISGVLTVVLTSIALRYWMRIAKMKSENISRVPITKNDVFDLKRKFPFFNQLSSSKQIEMQDQIGLVLARFRFIDESGEHYSKLNSIQIAIYIVLSNPLNLSNVKDCVIANSVIIIDKLNDKNLVYSFPLKEIVQENTLCLLSFNELSQQKLVKEFSNFISNITKN
jgi:hypothetical protein